MRGSTASRRPNLRAVSMRPSRYIFVEGRPLRSRIETRERGDTLCEGGGVWMIGCGLYGMAGGPRRVYH